MESQHLCSEQATQEHLDISEYVQKCLEIATIIFLARYMYQIQSQSSSHHLGPVTTGRRKPRSFRTRPRREQNEPANIPLEPLKTGHEQVATQEKAPSMPFPNEMFHGSLATVKLPQCENQDVVRPEGQAQSVDREDLDTQQRALLKLFKPISEPADERKSSVLVNKGGHDAGGDESANGSPQHDSQADRTHQILTLPSRPSRPAEPEVGSKNSRHFEVHRDLDGRHSNNRQSQRQAQNNLSHRDPNVRLDKVDRIAESSSLRYEMKLHSHNGDRRQRLSSNTRVTEKLSLTTLGETEPLGSPSYVCSGPALAPVGHGRPRYDKQISLPKPVLKDVQNRERAASVAKKNVTFTRSTELRDEAKRGTHGTAAIGIAIKDQPSLGLLSHAESASSLVESQLPKDTLTSQKAIAAPKNAQIRTQPSPHLPLPSDITRNANIEMVPIDRAFKKLILSGNHQDRTCEKSWMNEVQKHSEYSELPRPLSEAEADWIAEPTVGSSKGARFDSLKRCRQDGENDWDIADYAEEGERRKKWTPKSALRILKWQRHLG